MDREQLLAATRHPPPPARLKLGGVFPLALLPLLLKLRLRKKAPAPVPVTPTPGDPMHRNPLALRGQWSWPHAGGWGNDLIRGGQSYDDDEFEFMLGQIDEELDLLGWEIDAFDDTDDEMTLGRMGQGLAARISRIEAKIANARDKLSTSTRPGQQRRLGNKIERLEAKLVKLRGRLERKLGKKVQKGKMAPATAAAIGAGAGLAGGAGLGYALAAPGIGIPATGPAVQAYSHLDYPIAPFTGRVPPTQVVNEVRRTPSAGEEIRLPFNLNNSPIVRVTFAANPAGPVPQVATLVLQTRLIPYAAFQCTSMDNILQILPNPEAFVTGQATFVGVQGEKNLLYDTEPLEFAGQFGGQSSGRTVAGLRENQIVQPVNTVTETLIIQQETNTTSDIEIVVKSGIVVRSIYDPAARR